MADSRRPTWLLLPLGALVVVATIAGSFVFPSTPIRMARSSAGLIDRSVVWSALASLPWPVPTEGPAIAASLVIVGGIAIVAYAGAVAVAWDRPATRWLLAAVLVPALLALGVSTLALPTQSTDIIDYLLSGRVAVVHGASPYDAPPDAFPDDPFLPYASGRYSSDPEAKPPVWLGAAIGAAALTADTAPADAVLSGRFLFLALTTLNAALIALILRRWRPGHVLAGLVLYTWNPIILLHGQAKLDTLMATFTLLAALALVHARPVATVAALWLSVMVKLLTVPLLAISVLGDFAARQWRRLAINAALIAGMTVALYVSLGVRISEIVSHLTDAAGSGESLSAPVSFAVVAVAGIAVLWAGLTARGEPERTLQGWALATLATIPLGLSGFAWYLVTAIAVVSLSGERWRTAILVAASSVAFLKDSWGRHSSAAYPLPVPFGLSRTDALVIGVVILTSGIVGAFAFAAWSRRRGRGGSIRDTGTRVLQVGRGGTRVGDRGTVA